MRKYIGFHFLEILIALAIISILATFSIPLYTDYLMKERRLEAKTALTKLAIAIEQYEIEHNSYQNITLANLHADEFIAQNHYQLSFKIKPNHQYVLMANPTHAQKKDKQCGRLILNSNGERKITGEGEINECW